MPLITFLSLAENLITDYPNKQEAIKLFNTLTRDNMAELKSIPTT